VVNQVLFQGNKKHKDAVLQGVVQLKPRGTFSSRQMEADAEAIRQAYSRIGRDDATVTTQVMDLGGNRVNVVFTVQKAAAPRSPRSISSATTRLAIGRLADVMSTKKSNIPVVPVPRRHL
jgi:outer membrane protein insertion porin family